MLPHPPISTLFPYTTLFRSRRPLLLLGEDRAHGQADAKRLGAGPADLQHVVVLVGRDRRERPRVADRLRSEEHTSELQSLRHLVCRLLLEKKKKRQETRNTS